MARSTSSNAKLSWSSDAIEAFNTSKELLSAATLLHYPKRNAETSIAVDASDIAIGGVLQQRIDSIWKPIAFFSKKLNNRQRKYLTFSKELLVIYSAIKQFRHYGECSSFYILTDHQPILRALHKKTAREIPREERWLDFISIDTTDIRYIRGSRNIVADALSRHLDNTDERTSNQEVSVASLYLEDDRDQLLSHQTDNTELQQLLSGDSSCSSALVKIGFLF